MCRIAKALGEYLLLFEITAYKFRMVPAILENSPQRVRFDLRKTLLDLGRAGVVRILLGPRSGRRRNGAATRWHCRGRKLGRGFPRPQTTRR